MSEKAISHTAGVSMTDVSSHIFWRWLHVNSKGVIKKKKEEESFKTDM